jgi:hypothetical protein
MEFAITEEPKQGKNKANAGGNKKPRTCKRCKKRIRKAKEEGQAVCNHCVEVMRANKKHKQKKYGLSGEGHQKQCSNCGCYYGIPKPKQKKTTKQLLCTGCKRTNNNEKEKLMLAEWKAFFIYAGVQVQIAPCLKSKKAKKNAYNDWICTKLEKSRIWKEPLLIEEWCKFERSFKLNKSTHNGGYDCVNTTSGRRVCYPVNDSPASHNISVQYMLKQRAKTTGKTKNRSKTTTKNNAAAGKKGENSSSSTAARTCSQCFEKKSQDEFTSNQWHKGIAGRCQTCINKHQRPPPQSIFKAALEDKFRALLSTHLCDASNWICSRAIVTYVGLNSNGVTFNMGNFDIHQSANGTLVYASSARKDTLRLVSKSYCSTIKIRIFGTQEPGACLPPKYIYVLLKQGQNLVQFSPEEHLQSVIESNEFYPEDCEHYC